MEERLFYPRSDRPMHVAVFGSGSGTILRAMLAAQTSFAIRLLYTDRECGFQKIAEEHRLPLIYNPWIPGISRLEYDQKGLDLLLAFSEPIDLLLLAGYMRIVSSVWLAAFPHRILNIHPADLTELDATGRRKLIGANAVLKALQDGYFKTRTTAILVDETVDGGPIVASGPWVPYRGSHPVTQEKANQHQAIQKQKSDWPTCLAALQLLSEGRIGFNPTSKEVFLDGKPLPLCGYETPEEPKE